MKNILRLLIVIFIGSACNTEPEYELPYELSPNTEANMTVEFNSEATCSNISVDSEGTVYYALLPADEEAPNSYQLFFGEDREGVVFPYAVQELNFDEAGSENLSFAGFQPGENYILYAITVNTNGTRSEEVTSYSFTVPSAIELIDSVVSENYTGYPTAFDDNAPTFDATLTQTGEMTFSAPSLWGPNFVAWAAGNPAYEGMFPYPGTITIHDDLSVTVTGGDTYATGGTGYFDPCTNEVHMTLSQAVFTSPFTVDVVLSVE